MRLVQRDFDVGRLDLVSETLERQKPQGSEKDLRGFEWNYFRSLLVGESKTIQVGNSASVFHAAASPDGKLVATLGLAGGIRVWDAETLQLVFQPPSKTGTGVVWFSADSSILLAMDARTAPTTTVERWDLRKQKRLPNLVSLTAAQFRLSPIVDATNDRFAVICCRTEMPDVSQLTDPQAIMKAQVAALVNGTPWKEIQVWDLDAPGNMKTVGKKTEGKEAMLGGPHTIAFHPFKDLLLVGGGNGPNMPANPDSYVLELLDLASDEVVRLSKDILPW